MNCLIYNYAPNEIAGTPPERMSTEDWFSIEETRENIVLAQNDKRPNRPVLIEEEHLTESGSSEQTRPSIERRVFGDQRQNSNIWLESPKHLSFEAYYETSSEIEVRKTELGEALSALNRLDEFTHSNESSPADPLGRKEELEILIIKALLEIGDITFQKWLVEERVQKTGNDYAAILPRFEATIRLLQENLIDIIKDARICFTKETENNLDDVIEHLTLQKYHTRNIGGKNEETNEFILKTCKRILGDYLG